MDYITFQSIFLTNMSQTTIDPKIMAEAQRLFRAYRFTQSQAHDREIDSYIDIIDKDGHDKLSVNGVFRQADISHVAELNNNANASKKRWKDYCKEHGIDTNDHTIF